MIASGANDTFRKTSAIFYIFIEWRIVHERYNVSSQFLTSLTDYEYPPVTLKYIEFFLISQIFENFIRLLKVRNILYQ